MNVFVLDRKGAPLMPCSPKRAKEFLATKRARVHTLHPFTIRLVDRTASASAFQDIRLSIDPGSRTTGFSLSRIHRVKASGDAPGFSILFLMELVHRGQQIKNALTRRSMRRKTRRARNTRYRKARFLNRKKPKGWLPPSQRHLIDTTQSWIGRLMRVAPITRLGLETVRFDTQKMENPEINNVEYQHGTLFGFEVGEYLLEKWHHACAYCQDGGVPLVKDHLIPRANGGTDRVSNLVLSCNPCNQKKGNRPIDEFLKNRPALLAKILAQSKASLKEAGALNSTRLAHREMVSEFGLPVETGTGATTKHNRHVLGLPKTHALDAACVGKVGMIFGAETPVLSVFCSGRGVRQRVQVDKNGFPRAHMSRTKMVYSAKPTPGTKPVGFKTGDLVAATRVRSGGPGKEKGVYVGRATVRERGQFDIALSGGRKMSARVENCRLLARGDGYAYSWLKAGTMSPSSGKGR